MKRGRKIPRARIDHYICFQCDRWFETQEDIEEHIEKKHLEDE